MQQHEPAIPVALTSVPPVSDPAQQAPARLRLLIAVVLGLTSPFFLSPIRIDPWWWQPAVAIAVLLVAALLSRRSLVAAAVTVVAIGGLGAAFLAVRQMAEAAGSPPGTGPATLQWNLLAAALVPVLVGLASALVVQRHRNVPLAFGGAALGWLGAVLANLGAATFSPNPEGVVTELVIVGALSIVGFAFALLGGGLGGLLRF
jgi:hypothetical protein